MQLKSQEESKYPQIAAATGRSDEEIELFFAYEVARGIAFFVAWAHGKAISRGRALYTSGHNRHNRRARKHHVRKTVAYLKSRASGKKKKKGKKKSKSY